MAAFLASSVDVKFKVESVIGSEKFPNENSRLSFALTPEVIPKFPNVNWDVPSVNCLPTNLSPKVSLPLPMLLYPFAMY